MQNNTRESRSNQVITEARRQMQFASSIAEEHNSPLRINHRNVALAAAASPYNDMATEDLIAMAQVHAQAVGFRAVHISSRGTAFAVLLGVRIG